MAIRPAGGAFWSALLADVFDEASAVEVLHTHMLDRVGSSARQVPITRLRLSDGHSP